jgi:hypothetical protein
MKVPVRRVTPRRTRNMAIPGTIDEGTLPDFLAMRPSPARDGLTAYYRVGRKYYRSDRFESHIQWLS